MLIRGERLLDFGLRFYRGNVRRYDRQALIVVNPQSTEKMSVAVC